MGRSRAGNQEAFPWLPLPEAVVPFFRGSMPGICGSIAGVRRYYLGVLAHFLTSVQGHILGGDISLRCVRAPSIPSHDSFLIFLLWQSQNQTPAEKACWPNAQRRLGDVNSPHSGYVPRAQNKSIPFDHWQSLGPDPQNPRPITSGIARIYRGLGVSAVRSMATHGLMWTVYEWVSNYIDALPHNAT